MANFYSGKDGALYVGKATDGSTVEIAKLQNWSFSMSMAVIESTSMGDTDRVLHNGLRSYSGSARAFYYTDAVGGDSKLNKVLTAAIKESEGTAGGDGANAESEQVTIECVLKDGSAPRSLVFNAWITSVGISSSVGEVTSVDFSWEANGAPLGTSVRLAE